MTAPIIPLDSHHLLDVYKLIDESNLTTDHDFGRVSPHPDSLTPGDLEELLADDKTRVRVYVRLREDKKDVFPSAVMTYILDKNSYTIKDISWGSGLEGDALDLLKFLRDEKAARSGIRRYLTWEIPDGLWHKIRLAKEFGMTVKLKRDGNVWQGKCYVPAISEVA